MKVTFTKRVPIWPLHDQITNNPGLYNCSWGSNLTIKSHLYRMHFKELYCLSKIQRLQSFLTQFHDSSRPGKWKYNFMTFHEIFHAARTLYNETVLHKPLNAVFLLYFVGQFYVGITITEAGHISHLDVCQLEEVCPLLVLHLHNVKDALNFLQMITEWGKKETTSPLSDDLNFRIIYI